MQIISVYPTIHQINFSNYHTAKKLWGNYCNESIDIIEAIKVCREKFNWLNLLDFVIRVRFVLKLIFIFSLEDRKYVFINSVMFDF